MNITIALLSSIISVLLFLPASVAAELSKNEAIYLGHSDSVPTTGLVLEDDEILQFETDVTGDNKPEVFFSRKSLRNGKAGHAWSVYRKDESGMIKLIGVATFRHDAMTPSIWTQDNQSQGFYSYHPGGGGKGVLLFYTVNTSGITCVETRKVEPEGKDKAEFDRLFAAQISGQSSKIELKRTALSK